MRTVILWRHGRTQWNAEQRFQGQSDIPLDEVGRAQAVRAASMLATLKPSLIISSDLMRARETAEALGSLSGSQVIADERLRETFAGEWEGLTREVLETRFGPELAAWGRDSTVRPGTTGETRLEVAERMVAAIDEHVATLDADGVLVVATHGGAARSAICRMLELPHHTWGALGVLTNCSWSVLAESPAAGGRPWRLMEYNAGTLPEPALGDDR